MPEFHQAKAASDVAGALLPTDQKATGAAGAPAGGMTPLAAGTPTKKRKQGKAAEAAGQQRLIPVKCQRSTLSDCRRYIEATQGDKIATKEEPAQGKDSKDRTEDNGDEA